MICIAADDNELLTQITDYGFEGYMNVILVEYSCDPG